MISVAKRQPKTQPDNARQTSIDAVKISSQAALFHWLKQVSQLTPLLGGNGVAFALRLFIARNKRDGFSFPSHRTIARDLGVSEASTYRYQKKLLEVGLLVVEKRKTQRARHYHNLYFLSLPKGTEVGGKQLENNDNILAPLRAGDVDDLSPVIGRGNEKPADHSSEAENSPPAGDLGATISHQCEVDTSHQCETNHILSNQGEPTGSPLLSSQNDLSIVAREAAPPADLEGRGALDARPDQLRSEVDPDQLAFFDRLGPHHQRHFLSLSADDRENFQLAYEVDDDD
ncbi:hypothetical protein [Rhizobium leguminosarum]|uniref:hypothetical protein n=1 Tax=Rhizobium leguminosarum TaxID=384 RepID=UPI00102F8C8F|nr:hypothetical protein [Rhizobium leguminosarum]TBG20633.1 hypothetical protein ELG81_08740 [Rhizobium leguminosarum]TBG46549.1 hypothetical protein ELG75_08755 [Rhizobium leguminosarum]TBG79520.1 hypothetical protein ELG76_09090 [Rhizobium leguminosarum]